MRLTKLGHACVRIEQGDTTVVIDPGMFTEPEAFQGADAVLITHEHFDHFAEDRLRAAVAADPGLRIWTNRAVAAQLDGIGANVRVVGEGDAFEVGGIDVSVHGEWHAVIHPDIPQVGNIGFLLDGRLFHPGDALTVPPQPVETLLLPVAGPWSKLGELIDYVREVKPQRALGIHEVLLSEPGMMVATRMLGEGGPGTGAPFEQLTTGGQLELDAR
ncbi:L-ascorbate metabolism protein UlaG (beta-lactamase superfamily) [Kitasatospora sp. MAP12-15]|uniref:MBL fold metallo-hydrolase n=1 Tax=unclassified Kitasatospora TaxID=2633591 RepID=UPI00247549D5|nr:MBL fold metallo-hydrolase [Kitasatospora sp. MAP12-44]MDH6109905.1 L-ascorbate metabolism protein UlaG (beta-lactamase superfamily) [Kitasatospora sp. MAP12-44]